MANRFWVGGTGNWSDTDHWSTESGGSNGADTPTSSDNVFIDSNSGFGAGGTITLDGMVTQECNDFTLSSGHTYTITGGQLNFYGSVTLESTVTFNVASPTFKNTTSETITSNGVVFGGEEFNVTGTGTLTLQDDLETTGQFYQSNGTFDANDNNLIANSFYFYADTGYTPTVVMGSGTWEVTGNGNVWGVDENNSEIVTITCETSTIKLTDSSENQKNFAPQANDSVGKVYNNIWLTGTGTGIFSIGGGTSNTFNDFKCDNPPHEIRFYGEDTTTVSTFNVSGTVGNLITISSEDEELEGLQHTLSCASGVISCDYLDISNSNATGGAAWYAGSHSNDTTNNDGWLFEDCPPDRYWIGGTGGWNNTDHWSIESGGSGGASVPGINENVFIDENSGFASGGTITCTDEYVVNIHDFICTSGHTYRVESYEGFEVYGSLELDANATYLLSNNLTMASTDTGETLTFNGATFERTESGENSGINFTGTGTWTLQDDLVVAGTFYQRNGTFYANDFNLTANDYNFYSGEGYTPTFYMGSGTWEATGANQGWTMLEDYGQIEFDVGTSVIKMTNTSSDEARFQGANRSSNIYNLWIDGDGTSIFHINGNVGFNDLKITPGNEVLFENGCTVTVTTFTVIGTEANPITINSEDNENQQTLSCSSGTINCDYLLISNSNATGGATWNAGSHSIDVINNDGWIFESEPPSPVLGCTDPTAINYNPLATQDDGSCIYATTQKGFKTMPLNLGRGRFMGKSI